MLLLLSLALAPGLALLIFVYLKDKYEPEPLKLVLKAFLFGGLSTVVIVAFWIFVKLSGLHGQSHFNRVYQALWTAFVQAAIPEELLKWLIFVLFFYKLKDFNEWFDGIVYASVISLGFATVENVLYVFSFGVKTGIMRAISAVPLHFMAGIAQGFFFSLAKFKGSKVFNSILALIAGIAIHGFYDFLLALSGLWFAILTVLYFIAVVWLSKKILNGLLEKSQFKNESE